MKQYHIRVFFLLTIHCLAYILLRIWITQLLKKMPLFKEHRILYFLTMDYFPI